MLTPERIKELSDRHLRVVGAGYVRPQDAEEFARAIESEVRRLHAENADRAARAPADSQPAPAPDYPPLPLVGAIGYASVVDIDIYAKTLTIGPHLPGVRDIALWTTDQMRAYVDADRAARAPAESVLEDAAFEAVRKKLCALPRYSFVLDDDGVVRRVRDRAGNWIEFDEAHALLDPVAVDAARKQDDALILQLVEALEYHRAQTRPIDRTGEAITAGRARLKGKP